MTATTNEPRATLTPYGRTLLTIALAKRSVGDRAGAREWIRRARLEGWAMRNGAPGGYDRIISDTLRRMGCGEMNPGHVEAFMRLEHGSLASLTGSDWNLAVRTAARCVALTSEKANQLFAEAMGCDRRAYRADRVRRLADLPPDVRARAVANGHGWIADISWGPIVTKDGETVYRAGTWVTSEAELATLAAMTETEFCRFMQHARELHLAAQRAGISPWGNQ